MEGLAAFVMIFIFMFLVFGAITAYLFGESVGFWTYVGLFMVSQISGIGGFLWLVFALITVLVGSDQMKAGAWSSIAFVVITTVGLIPILAPYFHLTFSLF